MSNELKATVHEIDGELVLDDPVAMAMIRAVRKNNCKNTFEMNADRVEHFKNRFSVNNVTASEAVIVILNVDDPNGKQIAEALMPDHNWQEYRDRGEIPFTRGLAMRDGIEEVLEIFDAEAASKLREMKETAVVVVDHFVAEIFPA
jgi:hypothetical protein